MEDNKKIETQEKELSALEKEIQESGWQPKDTYFFSHDFTARNDPKCRSLMRSHGIAAYGAFWIIVEMLRAEPNYELPHTLNTIETIAEEARSDLKWISEVIALCIELGLLQSDGETLWSWSLKGKMIPIENKRKGSSLGGRNSKGKSKSGRKSAKKISTEISTEEEPIQANSQDFNKNSTQFNIEQLPVQLNKNTAPKLKSIKEENSLLNNNPINISRAREDEKIESDLMKKARGLKDFLLKRESSAGLAVSGG